MAPQAADPAPDRRKGVESSQTLGRPRWVIKRIMAWLTGYRRIARRYERDHLRYPAFCDLAAVNHLPQTTAEDHHIGQGLSPSSCR